MKDSEKVEQNVNAREIIANVLRTLGMNAPSFSTATGIAYQRIFDLQRGRTKKFNPGVVNMICKAFPTIRKEYLYTGEGSVLNGNVPADLESCPVQTTTNEDITNMLNKVIDLMTQVTNKDEALEEKSQMLLEKEKELMQREIDLVKRENELMMKEYALGLKKD